MTMNPEQTPEQIDREAAINAVYEMERAFVTSEWGTVVRKLDVIEELRNLPAAGLLVSPPSEEQIEQAAWERFPELDPDYASMTYPAEAMRTYNRAAFVSGARWSAAGVAPQEQSESWVDRQLSAEVAAKVGLDPTSPALDREQREKLISEALERAEHRSTGSNVAQCLRELAAALAAAPVVDEASLIRFLTWRAIPGGEGPDRLLTPEQAVSLARAIAERLRGEQA